MFDDLLRLTKRFAVLLLGIGIVYVAVENIYPLFNRRLPALVAGIVTYIVFAYVLIPALIRLIRLVSRPRHVPFYSTTPDGFACDPINIGFFGTRQEVISAMGKIGWHQADPRTLKSIFRMIYSILLKRPYPTAPFSTLYLFGRGQDLGFQLPVSNNPRHRHHVRFWAVKPEVAESFKQHVAFWQAHQPAGRLKPGDFLWLGAASLDTGLGIIRHNAQITHTVHHDTNAERELLVKSLRAAKAITKTHNVMVAKPYQLQNRVISAYLLADGKLTICEL